MEAEDVINLAASEDENDDILDCGGGRVEADSQPIAFVDKESKSRVESMELSEGNAGTDDSQFVEEIKEKKDFVDDSYIMQVNVEQTETVELAGKVTELDTTKHVQNAFLDVQNESPIRNRMMDVSSVSGVKRARMEYDENQPAVHVIYKSLTRASKQKLEELLQQWSEWQAQHGSSLNDQNEPVESGEETYFPAICVGTKKGSAVSFWIDNQTNQQNEGFVPLDSNTTPLYDRGYALGLTLGDDSSNAEGGLKIIDDASRCFNCGSYSHSLKECPKPRDNVAVQNARQQLKSKRNQNSASRNPTRYYQNSSGGKYDGLRPGALHAETRRLLGLGELDPPPWLNRMRELGYPPGYLDPDDEDEPSGITIYADGEVKEEEEEDGEIIETKTPEPRRKMSVDFPGINAPIPENADERLWAAGPSNSDPSRDRPHHRWNHHSESVSRGHHHDQRWSRDSRDDGPHGCDIVSSYPPRYGSRDFGYDSHSRSPILGRSSSERGRRSPLVYEDYIDDGAYRRLSPPAYGVGRYENDVDRYRDNYNLGRSSRSIDEYDRHRRRSGRR